jgi:cytochrome b subunit of formate dehydrogenase
MDSRLGDFITPEEYRKVISDINWIVENNFLSFKKKSDPEVSGYNKCSFVLSVIGIVLLMIYIIIWPILILMILAWSFLGLGLILNFIGVILRQNSLHKSKSIITQIQ